MLIVQGRSENIVCVYRKLMVDSKWCYRPHEGIAAHANC